MIRFRGWINRCRDCKSSNTTANTEGKTFNVRFFSYETLRNASNNFSTCIGDGSYGSVFKGVLPEDGRTVAIKRLKIPYRGFLEKVEFMSSLRHVNLIQIIGCCVENGKQLLVCEYAANSTLCEQLHSSKSTAFNWERRAAVCIGIARGLSYLHEEINPRIIHCDIKPSNILLDGDFVPKIIDFDLIHFVDGCNTSSAKGRKGLEKTNSNTKKTIKGTVGYLDPEYYFKGRLTQKVDVYSFGLVMLEIITGRKAVDLASKEVHDRCILNYVMRMRKDDDILKIVDPKLTDFVKEDVARFINVALLCTQANSEQRPSMFRVVHMLYGGHKTDQEISEMATVVFNSEPAHWFSYHSTPTSGSTSSSLTLSTPGTEDITDGSTSTRMMECASQSRGKCPSSRKDDEEESCEEDVVTAYFERSMEKIMRFQAAAHSASQTMAMGRSSRRVSMEVVYPPFQSGEYRRPSHC